MDKTITLENVKQLLHEDNPIKVSRIYGNNTINTYKLLETAYIQLSDNNFITIPSGYIWDLSSVPRFLWSLLPPDGDFQIAALIHDFLYEYRLRERKFCDNEMYTWSKTVDRKSVV